jgi:hypothetical protein
MRSNLGVAALWAMAASLALSSSAAADSLHGDAGAASRHLSMSTQVTSAAKAGTAVNLGHLPMGPTATCPSPYTGVQTATAPASPSYITPFAGIITAFSYTANASPGQVRAILFVPGAAGHLTVVGKTSLQTVSLNVVNTFATRVPVPAGALLGSQVTATLMSCAQPSVVPDTISYGPFDPDASNDFVPPITGPFLWNIAAVLEADADGDGYGDVTQDACPESALSQAACPAPNTIVKKKPAKQSTNRNVKIKFKSGIPRSTFQCSLDGKKFKSCKSPYRKRLGLGKHKVQIRAVSPVGIAELKPAKVKFRIVAPT